MRRPVLFLSLALAASGAAAQPLPGTQTLQMDSGRADIGFTLDGARTRFAETAGAMEYDPAHPLKSTIALSLDTASIEAEASRKLFDPDRFPEMRIISTADGKGGKSGMEALPVNVTIRDITRPILLQVRFKPAGAIVTLHAEGMVKAADFRLGKSGDVPLVIDAPFVRVDAGGR
jgi:polyisoprenoid-binding protein YceI